MTYPALPFGPLIAVFSILFVGTYILLGSDFIHGGTEYGGAPSYVSPEAGGLLRTSTQPTLNRRTTESGGPPFARARGQSS